MLPVVAGLDETRRQILIYALILAPLAVTPALIGLGGIGYALVSVALGAVLLGLSIRVWRVREGRGADKAARALFSFSILYLFLLFAVLLVERLVKVPPALALWPG
jgi:protoheme IX farnesyltransferase